MFLSVIIPMYNSEKYLSGLFEVINNFDNSNVEFILVDDGSSDNTYFLCHKYCVEKNGVVVYHNENHGVSYSRNYGLRHANGEYVMFCDSDDVLNTNWFEIISNTVKLNGNQDVFVFSGNVNQSKPLLTDIVNCIVGLPTALQCNYLGAPWSKIYKRAYLADKEIVFDESIMHGEDALFNLKVFMNTEKYHFEAQSVYSYLINYSSATHLYNSRFLDSNQNYLTLFENILNMNGKFDSMYCEKAISFSFINSIYIFSGKVSKINSFPERIKAVRDFYSRTYYCRMMRELYPSSECGLLKSIIYYLVKYKLLYLLEFVLPIVRRKNEHREPYWIAV